MTKIQLFDVFLKRSDDHENIGINRISSFLSENNVKNELALLYYDNDFETEYKKIDLECTIFGFSVYEDNVEFILNLAARIKSINNNANIVLGGQFASDNADLIFNECSFIDFIILGHGEYSLLKLIEVIDQKKDIEALISENENIMTRSSRNKKAANVDINLLPWPNRDYLLKYNRLYAYISSAHGCVGNCSFCAKTPGKWTGRPINDVIEEIIHINKLTQIRCFVFTDGSFEDPGKLGKERIKEFCNKIMELPYKFAFRCFLRAESFKNCHEDREILSLMKQVGFMVYIGIESGNQDDLNLYNKRATVDDNKLIIKLLNEIGIPYVMGFIFINPYSNKEKLLENYNFLIESKCCDIFLYHKCLKAYRNTSIYEKLRNEKLIINEHLYKNDDLNYRFEDNFAEELVSFYDSSILNSSLLFKFNNDFRNLTILHNCMRVILDDIDDITIMIDKLKLEMLNTCKNIFEPIYTYGILNKDFEKQLEIEIKARMVHINNIKSKLLRKYIRQTNK